MGPAWAKKVTIVLHMIRDPYDMARSAYLYHRQVPPPSMEFWLSDLLDPCKFDAKVVGYYAKQVGVSAAQITAAVKECAAVRDKTCFGERNCTYSNMLNSLSDEDGIRLDAARF